MSKKLYVGNLSYQATEEQIRSLFTEHGPIESLAMINDRESGGFRGFCFVELDNAAADAAIAALNGQNIDGRELKVNEAKPREDRSSGGQYGGNNNRRSRY